MPCNINPFFQWLSHCLITSKIQLYLILITKNEKLMFSYELTETQSIYEHICSMFNFGQQLSTKNPKK